MDAGADGDEVIEAAIRLARPGIEIPDVRVISRFGTIATCRIRGRDVIAVHAAPEVISLKAARGLNPGFEPVLEPLGGAIPALPAYTPDRCQARPGTGADRGGGSGSLRRLGCRPGLRCVAVA